MPGIVQDSVISSEQNSPDPFGKGSATTTMEEKPEVEVDSSFESTSDESSQSTSGLKQEEVLPVEKVDGNGDKETTDKESEKPGTILLRFRIPEFFYFKFICNKNSSFKVGI